MTVEDLRGPLSDAIGYWEPRRWIYNLALAAVVLVHFALGYPASKAFLLSVDGALFVFILAVLANIAYCAAYIVDLFVQMSAFRENWRNRRWILLMIGTLFAAVITRFFALGFISGPTG